MHLVPSRLLFLITILLLWFNYSIQANPNVDTISNQFVSVEQSQDVLKLSSTNQKAELAVKYTIKDETEEINNAYIELTVSGGTSPYIYKWSNQSTPVSSPVAWH